MAKIMIYLNGGVAIYKMVRGTGGEGRGFIWIADIELVFLIVLK